MPSFSTDCGSGFRTRSCGRESCPGSGPRSGTSTAMAAGSDPSDVHRQGRDAMPNEPEGERAEDIRATTDAIRTDAARLAESERKKAGLEVTDPDLETLSERAVELADDIARKTRAEQGLSEEPA